MSFLPPIFDVFGDNFFKIDPNYAHTGAPWAPWGRSPHLKKYLPPKCKALLLSHSKTQWDGICRRWQYIWRIELLTFLLSHSKSQWDGIRVRWQYIWRIELSTFLLSHSKVWWDGIWVRWQYVDLLLRWCNLAPIQVVQGVIKKLEQNPWKYKNSG